MKANFVSVLHHNTKDKFEAVVDNISFNKEQVPCKRDTYMSQSDTGELSLSRLSMGELAFVGLNLGKQERKQATATPQLSESICMDPGLSSERRLANNAGRIDRSCIEIIT
ncbi:uncharacterized protein PgNI_11761 [Pyricularia grisea]|uniref:Uncharacterized protein n=1 Tax=Pyricularia grisea TaxID=148305 RepID=A0A6P8ANU9_PYRGI|nr:uncharacterized protein PgNI_11761 [Pyricularia grisea]TLD03714.1 hypothetical protein PgNI_11761 [Pyricularia grisea]